jgi:outer membrane protein assembly factor BamB
MGNCSTQPAFSRPNISHTPNTSKESVHLLWSKNEVYTSQNDFQPMVSAYAGLICVLGDLVYPPRNNVTCLDGTDGTTLWTKTIRTPSGILMDSDGIYVGNGGIAAISKFDQAGNTDWKHSWNESSVKYMYLYNGELQLFMLPEKFMVLNKDSGKQITVVDGERIVFGTETERFTINYSLESRSLNLENVNWQLDINSSSIRQAPLFTEDLVLLRTGRVIGTLLAIDRATGQISWKTENTIVSNTVYWPAKGILFALSESGELLSIDIASGNDVVLLSFSSTPFVLNGDEIVGGYELAFDESNDTLFVLLGDSRQMFAFKVE